MGVPQNIQWFKVSIDVGSFLGCKKWLVDPFYRGENGAHSGEG